MSALILGIESTSLLYPTGLFRVMYRRDIKLAVGVLLDGIRYDVVHLLSVVGSPSRLFTCGW